MAAASDRSQHLFVVRVWHEVSSVAPIAQWRGSVEHVTTGQRQFFADLHEIDRFIRQELAGSGAGINGTARPGPRALSKEQAALVQESFHHLLPDLDAMVMRFYERLFEQAPALRSLFGEDLVAQRAKFVTMLTVIVEGLDEYERIEQIVQNLGRRHTDYGARREHYPLLADALVWAIAATLGSHATPEVLGAWLAAYTLLGETMLSASPG